MKNGKLTRKIKRLEFLQVAIDTIEAEVEYRNEWLKKSEKSLQEYNQNEEELKDEWEAKRIQSDIERYTMELDEGKKLLADLEKMI